MTLRWRSTSARVALSVTGVASRTDTAWPAPTTAESPGSRVTPVVFGAAAVLAVSGSEWVAPRLSRTSATSEYVVEGTAGPTAVQRPSAPTVPVSGAPAAPVPDTPTSVPSLTETTSGAPSGRLPSAPSPARAATGVAATGAAEGAAAVAAARVAGFASAVRT